MIAVLLYTKKDAETGWLLYPTAKGKFRTEEKRQAYASLFADKAPPMPYAGAGRRFGPSTFSEAELRDAKLEHMKSHYSLPKDVSSFWEKDELAQSDLVYPLCTPTTTIMEHEDAHDAAVRALWEFTGLKEKQVEFVRDEGVKVFRVNVSIDKAKWEWMNHQAERRTLTDWDICAHDTLLDELGMPKVVYQSYCQTHGGPRFVTDLDKHIVDESTKILF